MMCRSVLSGLVVLGLLATGASIGRAEDSPESLARGARAVLKTHCFRCHHGKGSSDGEFNVIEHPNLLSPEFWTPSLVVPGKPDESEVYTRITRNIMPPRSVRERPSDADRETLKQWIAAGAPAFPAEVTVANEAGKRKFVTIAAVMTAARDYLRGLEPEDRRYIRFFTLHYQSNNPDLSEVDLRLARAAFSKAINSLSRKPRIVVPNAIDPAKTLFAIDIRDLNWERDDAIDELERAYPYGVSYDSHPNASLRLLDKDLRDLTRTRFPIFRADWFVATATRPPVYHALLHLPDNAGDLEHELGVRLQDDFLHPRPERVAIAGFKRSGVSGQNRQVERHDARLGGYWKSRDFKATNGRSNLSRFPLGPLNLFPVGKHPFADQAFIHDGGELIFPLPNGLQAYLLVDGKDKRIDAGPVEVVSDPKQTTSGTVEIVNGLSCMACHKQGMISEFKDEVRDSNAVFGDAEEQVRRLYVEPKEMQRLVAQDRDRFLGALEKAIGPFLREGPDASKPITQFVEPIGEVARYYRLEYLNVRDVARELDLDDPQTIVRNVGETKLKRLGLDGLLKEGGVVSRNEWEALDGISLMQQLAQELRLEPVIKR